MSTSLPVETVPPTDAPPSTEASTTTTTSTTTLPEATTLPATTTSTTTTSTTTTSTTTTTEPPLPTPTNDFAISVSTELPPSPVGDTYGPGNLVDGNLATAWNHCGSECGGFADDDARNGVDQSIVILFDEPTVLSGFSIANGYQKPDTFTYFRNNRVDRIRVDFDDGTSAAFELRDERGVQENFFEPRTVTIVTLVIESIYQGDGTFNDVALSEIAAWVSG